MRIRLFNAMFGANANAVVPGTGSSVGGGSGVPATGAAAAERCSSWEQTWLRASIAPMNGAIQIMAMWRPL